jgi:hypothetical protein
MSRWIDAHSVTCAICGSLANERETVRYQTPSGHFDNTVSI